jgi:hypothetical protein
VNPWIAAVIIAGVSVAAIAGKLLLRRRAPEGGWFTDSSRAAGTFGVLGTMFAVVLAFVIVIALESYQRARLQAGVEAVAVTELDKVAELFPEGARERLHGGLVCYARAVVEDEWPAMRDLRSSDLVERWIADMARTVADAEPRGARQEAAYGQWFDEESLRRDGRRGRLAEAAPFVPGLLWAVLILGAMLLIGFMLAQADRREGWVLQAMTIGSVSALIAGGLMVVTFLERPYEDHAGSIRPTEMQRTLELMERDAPGAPVPCDRRGAPLPS